MPPDVVAATGEALARRALELDELVWPLAPRPEALPTVAAYVSMGGEPSTRALLDLLRAAGVQVLLPVLLAGWAVGMLYGTIAAYNVTKPAPGGGVQHFAGSVANIPAIGQMGYIALTAFVINVVIAAILTFVFNAMKVSNGVDATIKGDYFADAGDPRVERHREMDAHLTTGTP